MPERMTMKRAACMDTQEEVSHMPYERGYDRLRVQGMVSLWPYPGREEDLPALDESGFFNADMSFLRTVRSTG